MADAEKFAENIRRFTGFADHYDRYRASPPTALADLVAHFSGKPRPALVVDLGSGTGLSTRYWADKADRVIGVEPTPDMRRQAEVATTATNVTYREGFSHHTGLETGCAQVVTCVQALHWMEPSGTFTEAARILAHGGVFATCDYDWPPATGSWEADAAFEECIRRGRTLEKERGIADRVRHWAKAEHFTRMQASSSFRYVRDLAVHHADQGNAERLVALLLSQGYIVSLQKIGVSDDELAIPELRDVAQRTLGDSMRPWLWTARVRIGVV